MKVRKKTKIPFIFLILGPPLSGKGTQAFLISQEFYLKHFSVGDFIREEIEKKTKKANKFKKIIEKGGLIPDSFVNEFIKKQIFSLKKEEGLIIDGFPRNLSQAKFLFKTTKQTNKDFLVIYLDVRNSFLFKRASLRRFCSLCNKVFKDGEIICPFCNTRLLKRKDDKKTVLQARLSEYRKNTLPALKLFEKRNKLLKIDGEGTIKEVFRDILEKLKEKINGNS